MISNSLPLLIYPFKLDVKECHFRLAIVVSSNPMNIFNAHSLHLKQCALTKLNGLLLTTVASQNGIHSRLV